MRLLVLAFVATVTVTAQEPTRFTRWVWDGVYTKSQATRGEPLYRQYCGNCHGPELQGRPDFPPPPASVPGGFRGWVFGTPPLKGATFISNWTDLSLADVFERNRISMPQNAPGSLSRQQNADILAYILQENGYAPGNGELGLTKEALDTIRIGK
jgi:S-disulfanyl-L-cysteine oxidoreductase SoxD